MFLRRLTLGLWIVALLALGEFVPITARASDRFLPVPAEDLAMKTEPQAPGAPAIILLRQVDRDDNGGLSRQGHEFDYVRIKILTEAGRKYADVEIPFRKEAEEITDIRARNIRPDGSIANYDGKVFVKTIVKAKGLKYLAKTFTLADVQVGSIIEYYYTINFAERYIFDSHWILSDELFTRSGKFSLKPYQSNYSRYNLGWGWHALPPGAPEPKKGSDGFVRLAVNNIPAFQTEDFMPPANEMKSRVDFAYTEEDNKNAETYWKNVGKRRNEALEHFIDKRKTMQDAVGQMISPQDPPDAKLQKIYSRVQQLRNTSYEVKKTEQEEKREKEKPATNVEDVWRRGYGDGVQLTWLYLALVKAAGFEAYGVWASDRSNYFFDPRILDSSRLDANVVLVKLNGKEIYCDPGAKLAPFGLVPWYETGVVGLRLDRDGGAWVKIPAPDSSVSRRERKADLKLSDTGDLQGKLTITFTGLEAMHRRQEERNEDEADRKKYLEDHVREYIPSAIEVELSNRPDWSNPAVPLTAEFNLKVPGWASGVGRRVLLPVGLFSGTEKRLFEHAARIHPIYMEYPFQNVDDIAIEIPQGWKVGSLPPAEKHDGHIVKYSMTVENANGKLQLARVFDVDFLLLDTKYYTALRNFLQTVRTGDEQQIVLQPGTATASN